MFPKGRPHLASGLKDWLGTHALTMCLGVTFQVLWANSSPWQQCLIFFNLVTLWNRALGSWNLFSLSFCCHLEMSELCFSVLSSCCHWLFQTSSLILESVTGKCKTTENTSQWCFPNVCADSILSMNSWWWCPQGPEGSSLSPNPFNSW